MLHALCCKEISICKDFPERQGMDTWRGMLHVATVRKFQVQFVRISRRDIISYS